MLRGVWEYSRVLRGVWEHSRALRGVLGQNRAIRGILGRSRMLRGRVGPNRENIIGGWKKLHKDVFIYTCASTNVIGVIKSRSMGRVRHEVYKGG